MIGTVFHTKDSMLKYSRKPSKSLSNCFNFKSGCSWEIIVSMSTKIFDCEVVMGIVGLGMKSKMGWVLIIPCVKELADASSTTDAIIVRDATSLELCLTGVLAIGHQVVNLMSFKTLGHAHYEH